MTTEPVEPERPQAMEVLRRGLRESPELRDGIVVSIAMAITVAAGRIVIPIAIQQILRRGITGPSGYRPGFVAVAAAVAAVVVIAIAFASRATYLRLVTASENALAALRTRVFAHIHALSIAHHGETRRGVLVARVTSDIETLAQFAQWGAISWVVNTTVIVATLLVMAVYSWQLALLTAAVFVPVAPLLRWVQRRQIVAYDHLRTTVGDSIAEASEAVMGAAVIRAYGVERLKRQTLHRAVARQYKAQMRAAWYFALMFPVSDVFGATAIGMVVGVGAWYGPGWGLDASSLVACVLLTSLILQPIGEIGEVLDQTQTAVAGWAKVLDVLDEPIDVVEPASGVALPSGALRVDFDKVWFRYEPTHWALREVSFSVEAGQHVAVVGETGSGKSTIAKLLCRLADPERGEIRIGGVPLAEVDPAQRRHHIRLVPQDGFLFDTTVAENVMAGTPEVTLADVDAAVDDLGLRSWVDRLPEGLATPTGERGEALSLGERQLVALLRAQISDPSLLVLDEATSSVDPETERALSEAFVALAKGRTTITIAHRLSTAENSDLVVVVAHGEVVAIGTHTELLETSPDYATMFAAWVGATAVDPAGLT